MPGTHRFLATGGFLGFLALLLLVVFTGMRLFGEEGRPLADPERRIYVESPELKLTDADWQPVGRGVVAWGAYKPGGLTGQLARVLRSLPDLDDPAGGSAAPDWQESLAPLVTALRSSGHDDDAARLEALAELAFEESESGAALRSWADGVAETLRERGRALLPEIYRVDDDFAISTTEVTQEQWFAFLLARSRRSGQQPPDRYFPRSWRRGSGHELVPWIYASNEHDLPVTDIDFRTAVEFCQWIWEEHLGADPNLTVDVPTTLEFARAGRGGLYVNYPWGPNRDAGIAVLSDRLRAVSDASRVGDYNGVRGIVGNAAEWIYFDSGRNDRFSSIAAAGWSYLPLDPVASAFPDTVQSPFSSSGVESNLLMDERRPHIGFRFVLRRATARPMFIHVDAGPISFVQRTSPVIRDRVKADPSAPFPDMVEVAPLSVPKSARESTMRFSVAASEITNRQYLAFLDALSAAENGLNEDLYPRFWYRPHPFTGQDVVFQGALGDPNTLTRLFDAGTENYPVLGISPAQATAYAKWIGKVTRSTVRLPTAAEFIRAGRGEGDAPYPWGDSTGRPELVCSGRADDQDRVASLASFLEQSVVVGLCGNALELVVAPGGGYWLAGGCFDLPAEACTLDAFLDPAWKVVHIPFEGGEAPIPLQDNTGFRVVREEQDR